jgi:hypothetical protein
VTAAGGEIPLADHASLVLRAGRLGPVLPHMAWALRFSERLDAQTLTEEAERLASSPYAFGRRVRPRRIPGGRSRWYATTAAPPIRLSSTPIGPDGFGAWLDEQLVVTLDPEHEFGWMICATPTSDGGSIVLVVAHHLFGTAPGLLNAAYGEDTEAPLHGTTEAMFTAESAYTWRSEMAGVYQRVDLGIRGVRRAAGDAARLALARRHASPPPPVEPPPLRPRRTVDRTRLAPSPRRRGAVASFEAEIWDGAATAHGGTANTLLAAMTANLVRKGRANRKGDVARPVRLVLPIDLGADALRARSDGASGPRATMVTASLVLPGGPAQYGDLTIIRRWMKAAFAADSVTAPPVRGVNDATGLLPEALTIRVAKRAAMGFDACASNPGAVPPGAYRIGPHTASELAVIGLPIGLDLILALSRSDSHVYVSAVADPGRLGPGSDFRSWFADELAKWGLPDRIW